MIMKGFHSLALCAAASVVSAVQLTVSTSGGNTTTPLQYGIFFEDINYSGDGGIYAELVQNRAFQGSQYIPKTIKPWTAIGNVGLSLENLTAPLSEALPTSLQVTVNNGTTGQVGISNPGWWGIDVKVQPYVGSFWVQGAYNGTFTASLNSALRNQSYGSVQVQSQSNVNGFTQHFFNITPSAAAPESNNTLVITFDAASATSGNLNFNLISLFPPTYNNRPNGLRPDLVNLLKDLGTSFFRFPGGNNLEGEWEPFWLNWTSTLGPLQNRPGRPGAWGYSNTDGLGLVEYFEWCFDLGLEPILAIFDGLFLNQGGTIVPSDQLDPYVQSAMDELEFVLGDANTTWGAVRASLGHPDPWPVKYVEIGNEDNIGNENNLLTYEQYRFKAFYDPIHAKYPDLTLIPSTINYTSFPGNALGDFHDYGTPDQLVEFFDYFDKYPANRTLYVGEYASVENNVPNFVPSPNSFTTQWNYTNWIGTVAEAVFLLGIERNADKVFGSCYAPLLQNLNMYQYAPNLITFTADPEQNFVSTSYPAIQLYSSVRIAETLPATANDTYGPAYWVTGRNNGTNQHVLKAAVYNSTNDVPFMISFDGVQGNTSATLSVLTAPGPSVYNYMNNVVKSTVTTITAATDGMFSFSLPDYSIAVLAVDA